MNKKDCLPGSNAWEKTDAIALWRQQAHEYWERYTGRDLNSVGFRQRRDIMMKFLEKKQGGCVLDAGCGPAVYTRALVDEGADYHGIDGAEEMILMSKAAFPELAERFKLGSVTDMPYGNDFFDAALLAGVIEYIPRPEEALLELHRVLKPGGQLIASFRKKYSPYNFLSWNLFVPMSRFAKRVRAKAIGEASPLEVHVHYFTERKVDMILSQCGFACKRIESYGFSPIIPPFSLLVPDFSARIREKGQKWQNTMSSPFFTAFVVDARKV